MMLSKREKKVLDALKDVHSVKTAATSLKTSPATIYNILYRIRKRYTEARRFINTLLAYRRRSELLDKVLTPTIKLREEEEP